MQRTKAMYVSTSTPQCLDSGGVHLNNKTQTIENARIPTSRECSNYNISRMLELFSVVFAALWFVLWTLCVWQLHMSKKLTTVKSRV
jgi:hypothetical protein